MAQKEFACIQQLSLALFFLMYIKKIGDLMQRWKAEYLVKGSLVLLCNRKKACSLFVSLI